MPPKATPRMGVPKLKARWQVGRIRSGMSQLTVTKDMQLPLSVTATGAPQGRVAAGVGTRPLFKIPLSKSDHEQTGSCHNWGRPPGRAGVADEASELLSHR